MKKVHVIVESKKDYNKRKIEEFDFRLKSFLFLMLFVIWAGCAWLSFLFIKEFPESWNIAINTGNIWFMILVLVLTIVPVIYFVWKSLKK